MANSPENEGPELRAEFVSLTLGPKGVEIDAAGRIRFVNPEILQAIIAARATDLVAAEPVNNYFNCGSNNYQCGR